MYGGNRPLGITLLCLIGFLTSFITLLISGALIFLGMETGFLEQIPLEEIPLPLNPELLEAYGIGGGHIFSVLLLLLPIISFIFWWLLWRMNIIAWLLLVGSYGLTTFFAISAGALTAAIIPCAILAYLLLHTKSFIS